MTLSKTWKECLRMWKWIVKVWKLGGNVEKLKDKWLKAHGYNPTKIESACFFCQYANDTVGAGCHGCPAWKVEKGFSCSSADHSFVNPPAFYAKLLELDKKRKA